VTVVVLLKGDSYGALGAASELAVSAHREALASRLKSSAEGDVILYLIEGESISAVSEVFGSVAEALRCADT